MIASISATQTFTDSILQSADAVDADGEVVDNEAMFPILGKAAVAKIDDGLNKFNASTPQINKGFKFDNDNALLAVTKYTVKAAGTAEVRNALITVAAADEQLTRIVNKGIVQPGFEIGGIASFTEPSSSEQYMLGDADGDGEVTIVDATMIQRVLVNIPGAVINEAAADVDGDGEVTIIDATFIQRYLASMPVAFPINEYVD